MGRITSFLSDVFSGRSLEDQLQDEARERRPHTGGYPTGATPPDLTLRTANERTLERLKKMREVPEDFKPWDVVKKMPAGWSSGSILGVPFFHASEAEAVEMIQAARMKAMRAVRLEGKPELLEALRRAAEAPEPMRNTGLLQPGETRQEDFQDGLRRIGKDPVLAMPYGRHHAAKVEQMGGVPVPPSPARIAPEPHNFLIFINGDARSGKDTTAHLIVEAFEERGYMAKMHSSIEPVRQMLLSSGLDVSAKNEKDRKLLAEIGDLTEDYNGFRSNYSVAHFLGLTKRADAACKGSALILHTREPHTIHKIAFLSRSVPNLDVQTLFISGRGEAVETNKADAGVRGMVYDTTLANDGTVHDLAAKCDSYVDALTRNL